MQESLSRRSDRQTESLLLVVILIWAANASLVKFGISGMAIVDFNSIRFVIAAAILVTVHVARSSWKRIPLNDWWKLIGLGIIAHGIYQTAYLFGLKNTTVGNSAIILSTSPLWTVFFSAMIHKDKVPRQAWLGSGVSLSGIILIVIGTGARIEFSGNALLGDVLSLIAALLWALSTTLQKSFLTEYSPTQLSTILISVGAVIWTIAAVPSALAADWGTIGKGYYAAALGSGALSTGASTVLWAVGIQRFGPRRTANFNNLTPVFAIVFAYLILGEQVYPLQLVGATITLVGVWLARR